MPRRFDHALVVGDDLSKIFAQLLCRSEVDGIKRPEVRRLKRSRRVEDPVGDPDQVKAGKHLPAASYTGITLKEQSAKNLGASQRTRHHRSPATQVAAEADRLGFGNSQLHDGR
jgi:hypothetical protein